MQNLNYLKSKEIKQLKEQIEEQYGCKPQLDYTFLSNKEGEIFIITRDIEKIDFEKINVNNIGLYFAEQKDNKIRLTIEGTQIVGKTATKNVLELDDEQIKDYITGTEQEIDHEDTSYIILKNKKNDFFGCSKIKNKKLFNFYPKSRRISITS